MSVDLPTPLPAKMPMRWPRPKGVNVSIALMPVTKGSVIRARFRGCGVTKSSSATARRDNSPSSSNGWPNPLITRPSNWSPTGTRREWPVAITSLPGQMPFTSPSGMSSNLRSRKPTTSASMLCWVICDSMRQISPTDAMGPWDSITNPIICVTRPRFCTRRVPDKRERAWAKPLAALEGSTVSEAIMNQRLRARVVRAFRGGHQ